MDKIKKPNPNLSLTPFVYCAQTHTTKGILTMSFLETLSVIALAFFVWGSH
jgi:hypothetical protein